jgi:hypothetical protein
MLWCSFVIKLNKTLIRYADVEDTFYELQSPVPPGAIGPYLEKVIGPGVIGIGISEIKSSAYRSLNYVIDSITRKSRNGKPVNIRFIDDPHHYTINCRAYGDFRLYIDGNYHVFHRWSWDNFGYDEKLLPDTC